MIVNPNDDSTSFISLNHSGLPQLTVDNSDFSVQCCMFSYSSFRLVQNCTDTINNNLSEIKIKSNLSLEASRLAFKTACCSFYGHNFLSKEEAIHDQSDDVRSSSFSSSSYYLSVKPSKLSRESSFTLS